MNKTITSAKIYIDSAVFGDATEKSVENTSNDVIVKTDNGNVIQLGREDGQFTMNFVIPSGATGYSRLRTMQKQKKVVQVQLAVMGDVAVVAECIITSLGAQTTTADGSRTANVTLQHVQESEIVGFG